jgi:hypothetical protein
LSQSFAKIDYGVFHRREASGRQLWMQGPAIRAIQHAVAISVRIIWDGAKAQFFGIRQAVVIGVDLTVVMQRIKAVVNFPIVG